MSGLVTVWDKATGAVAWETQEVIVSGGVEGQPAVREDQPVRRLERLSIDDRSALAWTRPAWSGNLAARLDPAGHGAANFAPGWVILECVDVKPAPGVGEVLAADHDGGVVDLAAGTITYTWPVEPIGDAAAVAAAWSAAGAAARGRIEAAAETARLRFMTAGSGKALTYEAKRQEAARYALDQAPDPAAYPFAAAEAAAIGSTVAEVVATWQARAALWADQVGPAIEGLEQGGKLAVDLAVQARDASALAAAESIVWPSPG
jgi:hypothetical protein